MYNVYQYGASRKTYILVNKVMVNINNLNQ